VRCIAGRSRKLVKYAGYVLYIGGRSRKLVKYAGLFRCTIIWIMLAHLRQQALWRDTGNKQEETV
jgi:hypothetical protein